MVDCVCRPTRKQGNNIKTNNSPPLLPSVDRHISFATFDFQHMAPLKIIVFYGSVRDGRLGIRLANFVTEYLISKNMEVELFDPAVLDFPLLKQPLHFYAKESDAPAYLREYNEKIKAADGYVVVSGEYNLSIPPALSNILNHFPPSSYAYKPCSIVVYSMGPYGGVRAGVQLRSMLGVLGMVTPPYVWAVPKIQEQLSEDAQPLNAKMTTDVERVAKELEWFASALKSKAHQSPLSSFSPT